MNLTDQIIRAWWKAHEGAIDNPTLLLLCDSRFSGLCVERMHVCMKADELLYALTGDDLPEPLKRHLKAEADKGCPICWFSSMRRKTHPDGTPSCEDKIHEWFESKKALMEYAKVTLCH